MAFTFVLSLVLTEVSIRLARAVGLLDQPGKRSLHSIPTPRGGGVAIVGTMLVSVVVWSSTFDLPSNLVNILALSLAVAALGFWDDRVSLSAGFRIALQFVLASLVVGLLYVSGSDHTFALIGFGVVPAIVVCPVLILFVVWMTNLYNFMDGSDGLAGTQAVTVFAATSILATFRGDQDTAIFSQLLAAASSGFLFRNWQPAKIFMGDVGSVFLGFVSGAFALWTATRGSVSFLALVCLHGAFAIDATITLIVRIGRGKRPHEAHRTHAYQRWIQSGRSHRFVAVAYGAFNLCWLLPMAFFVDHNRDFTVQVLALSLAWAPWCVFVLSMKAGCDAPNPHGPTA